MQCETPQCPLQASKLLVTAKLFRGLSDPTRLAIIKALGYGPKRVVDLMGTTGRAQPNVSMHLACLRDCGLVRAAPSGRETFYSLVDERMTAMIKLADGLVASVGSQICDCERYQDDVPKKAETLK